MRHAKHAYSLNKSFSLRKALVISLAKNLLKYQRIKTTKNRAKATRVVVEKLITMGKEGSLAKKRMAYEVLGDHKLVSLLFSDIAPRFKTKTGGYTRILNLGTRRGDSADMVIFELTQIKEIKKKFSPSCGKRLTIGRKTIRSNIRISGARSRTCRLKASTKKEAARTRGASRQGRSVSAVPDFP